MTQRHINTALIVVGAILFALPAAADVLDAGSNGFTIRHQVFVEADRMTVYDAAVKEIGKWWSGDHTFSGDAANLYMTTSLPGCFCETLGAGAGLVHMSVTFVSPGAMIRLTGGLGPLGLMGADGNMTWEFAEAPGGSTFTLQYAVGGYLDGGLDAMAPAVDGVLLEAVTRLRTYVETGAPSQG